MTTYLKFEHAVVLVLTALISIIIVSAIWKLAIKILFTLVLSDTLDLTDLVAFQSVRAWQGLIQPAHIISSVPT